MAESILKSLSNADQKYSVLVENEAMVQEMGGIDNLISELDILVAKGFAKINRTYDEEEGDDFLYKISASGKAFLKMKSRKEE